MIIHLQERRLAQIIDRNACYENGSSLNGRNMVGSDEIVLACFDEMSHLLFDIVPNPDFAKVSRMLFRKSKNKTQLVKHQTRMIWAA